MKSHMYKANVHKIFILIFINTIIFARCKDLFQFIQQALFNKLGKNSDQKNHIRN